MRKMLKFLGIWNIVFGSLYMLSFFLFIPGVALLVSGIIFLGYDKKTDEEIKAKTGKILTWSIFFIFMNIVSAVVGFVLYDKIKTNVGLTDSLKKSAISEVPIDPEVKKLDLMLKLGVSLVILSGFIFATSNWSIMSDQIKSLLLLLLSGLFYSLSYLSRIRLKIIKSEITYYVLSLLFILFTAISVGYFKIFGEYFSFYGEGKNLYISLVFLLNAVLFYFAIKRYKKDNLAYFIYASLIFAITYVLAYFKLTFDYIILVNLLIIISSDLLKKNNKYIVLLNKFLSNYVYFVSIIIFFYTIFLNIKFNNLIPVNNILVLGGCFFILIGYLFSRMIKNSGSYISAIFPVIGLILGISIFTLFDVKYEFNIYIIIIINLLFHLIALYKNNDSKLFITTFIASNIILFATFCSSYTVNNYLPILISSSTLFSNIIISLNKENLNHYKFETYAQPFKLILFILSLFIIINDKTNYLVWYDFMLISSLVTILFYFFQKQPVIKYIYFITSIVFSTLYFLINLGELNIIFKAINLFIIALIYYITFKNEENKYKYLNNPIYILLVISIFTFFDFIGSYYNIIIYINILSILLIGFLAYFVRKSPKLFSFTLIFILLPYYSIIQELTLTITNNMIANNLPLLYLTLIFTRVMLKEISFKFKNIIEIILIILAFLPIIFSININIGLYVGLMSLIFILIGIRYHSFYSLFYLGIILTITNIVVQLGELWQKVPFPVYLLIAGLILIGIVTYKELSKSKIGEKIKSPSIENFQNVEKKDYSTLILGYVSFIIVTFVVFGFYINTKNSNIENMRNEQQSKIIIEEIKKYNKNIDYSKVDIKLYYYDKLINNAEIFVDQNYKISLKPIADRILKENKNCEITVYRVEKYNFENGTFENYYNYSKNYKYGITNETNLIIDVDNDVEYFSAVNDNSAYEFDSYLFDFDKINNPSIKLKIYDIYNTNGEEFSCTYTDYNEGKFGVNFIPDQTYDKDGVFVEFKLDAPARCKIQNNLFNSIDQTDYTDLNF